MRLFIVGIEIFDLWDCDIVFDTSYYHNVYRTFERDKEEGLKDLKKRIKEIKPVEVQ